MTLRPFASFAFAAALLAPAALAQAPAEGVEVRKPWLRLVPESMVNQTAAQQYAQMKQQAQAKGRLNADPAQTQRVRVIAARLIPQGERFHAGARGWRWEVNTIDSPAVNAFVLPGGKIMVYSGLIERLKLTDDELAAIVGHEIAHALLEHGRARMSEALVKNLGIGVASAYFGLSDLGTAALAQAAQVAVTLPYSRSHETDADLVGIELAARAGYDPRAAISVWQKMGRVGGGQPPELLSTHPANASRIRELEEAMPRVLPLYEAASKR